MAHSPLKLDQRTLEFSKNVLAFCTSEVASTIKKPLIEQLIRSSTSIGANYSEANNAASKIDFRNKIYIAKKEAAETEYWLSLFADVATNRNICLELLRECHFILMTLQKIISTINHGKK